MPWPVQAADVAAGACGRPPLPVRAADSHCRGARPAARALPHGGCPRPPLSRARGTAPRAPAPGRPSPGSVRAPAAQPCRLPGQPLHPLPVPRRHGTGRHHPRPAHAAHVGQRQMRGRGRRRDPARRAEPGLRQRPASADRYGAPPAACAGKNFMSRTPRSSSATTSDAVDTPGRYGTPAASIASSSEPVHPGLTRNRAPRPPRPPRTAPRRPCPRPPPPPAPRGHGPHRVQGRRRPQGHLDGGSPPATSARASAPPRLRPPRRPRAARARGPGPAQQPWAHRARRRARPAITVARSATTLPARRRQRHRPPHDPGGPAATGQCTCSDPGGPAGSRVSAPAPIPAAPPGHGSVHLLRSRRPRPARISAPAPPARPAPRASRPSRSLSLHRVPQVPQRLHQLAGEPGADPDSSRLRTMRPFVALLKWLTTFRVGACSTRTVAVRPATSPFGLHAAAYAADRRSHQAVPGRLGHHLRHGRPPERPQRTEPRQLHPHGAAVRRDPVVDPHRTPQPGEHQERPPGPLPRHRVERRQAQGVVQHPGVDLTGGPRTGRPQRGVLRDLAAQPSLSPSTSRALSPSAAHGSTSSSNTAARAPASPGSDSPSGSSGDPLPEAALPSEGGNSTSTMRLLRLRTYGSGGAAPPPARAPRPTGPGTATTSVQSAARPAPAYARRMPRRHLRVSGAAEAPLTAALRALRTELDLPHGFPPAVLAEAEAAAKSPRLPGRDATDLPLFTIDPPGSTDLDQAMHLARRADGGYRVHYAIADVSAFVEPGGARRLRRRTAASRPCTSPTGGSPCTLPCCPRAPPACCPPRPHRPSCGASTSTRTAAGSPPTCTAHWSAPAHGSTTRPCRGRSTRAPRRNRSPCCATSAGSARNGKPSAAGSPSTSPNSRSPLTDGGYRLTYRPPRPADAWNAQISLLAGTAAADLMTAAGTGVLRTLPTAPDGAVARLRRSAHALGVDWPHHVPYAALLRTLDPRDPRQAAFLQDCTTLLRGAGYTVFTDGSLPSTRRTPPSPTSTRTARPRCAASSTGTRASCASPPSRATSRPSGCGPHCPPCPRRWRTARAWPTASSGSAWTSWRPPCSWTGSARFSPASSWTSATRTRPSAPCTSGTPAVVARIDGADPEPLPLGERLAVRLTRAYPGRDKAHFVPA